jgi:hypothetical protein
LKALLTHLQISCTTHSSSLGWAFNRVELVVRSGARSSVISTLLAGREHPPGFDDEGVVTISALSTGRQGRSHSIPSIYDNALVLPQPRLPTHRERSTRS